MSESGHHRTSLDIGDELIADRRSGPEDLPPDMAPWMRRTIVVIDTLSFAVGYVVAFLVVPIFIAMVYEIAARYWFSAPTVWAYDISRMLYGAMFMLGAAYGLSRGLHIRADFLYRTLPVRAQAWIDLVLYLIFYFPGLGVLLWASTDFAYTSLVRGERGMDTAWMLLLGPVKAALPAGVALLLVQGVSEILKCCYAISRGRWP